MSFDEDTFGFDNMDDDYSLESILAEYKGSAFISGSSRLSKEELEKQARAIIEEYTNVSSPENTPAEVGDIISSPDPEEKIMPVPAKKVKV